MEQHERGILTTNGAYSGTLEPGLHWKWPFFQSVKSISVQQQATLWNCRADEQCEAPRRGEMQSYSKDQQPANLRVSVNWHVPVDKMEDIYTQYGGNLEAVVDRLIGRKAPQAVKTVFGQFTAASAIQDRANFNAQISKAVMESVDLDAPIVVDSVQVENIDYSQDYENSIESRMLAEVEVQKRRQEFEQEKIAADIALTKAQGAANSTLAQAKADAESITLRGNAEALAIKARGDALRDIQDLCN